MSFQQTSLSQAKQVINNSLIILLNEFPQKRNKEKYVNNFSAYQSNFEAILVGLFWWGADLFFPFIRDRQTFHKTKNTDEVRQKQLNAMKMSYSSQSSHYFRAYIDIYSSETVFVSSMN